MDLTFAKWRYYIKPRNFVRDILLIKDYEASITGSRKVVHTNLSLKEQYIAQQAKKAYLASIYPPEILFSLFYATFSTKFSSDDILY